MFKGLVIGFCAILGLVSIDVVSSVQNRLNKVFGVEPMVQAASGPAFSATSCEEATDFVSGAGFQHVFATKCSGAQYRFNGFRGGNEYTIVFNAQSKGLAAISR